MEENEKLEIGIGDKEIERLEAKEIEVQGVKIETVEKDGKKIGEKVILLSKHPDREDILHISTLKYIKGDKVETSGTWFNTDEDGKIQKGTALASLLTHFGIPSIGELVGKKLPTDFDSGGYLCIKAY